MRPADTLLVFLGTELADFLDLDSDGIVNLGRRIFGSLLGNPPLIPNAMPNNPTPPAASLSLGSLLLTAPNSNPPCISERPVFLLFRAALPAPLNPPVAPAPP